MSRFNNNCFAIAIGTFYNISHFKLTDYEYLIETETVTGGQKAKVTGSTENQDCNTFSETAIT